MVTSSNSSIDLVGSHRITSPRNREGPALMTCHGNCRISPTQNANHQNPEISIPVMSHARSRAATASVNVDVVDRRCRLRAISSFRRGCGLPRRRRQPDTLLERYARSSVTQARIRTSPSPAASLGKRVGAARDKPWREAYVEATA